ncbi:hypothetical protein COHA_009331 [Chlorella ohadii]|uniref:N-acetyltransferase domain-containing protein n=1 Tax=Chlorella ohadii TaxID=2649997 RepID=A0AAD5DF02_9CHLO|nr:hypothetical protein COHA_009331 [Chlorella ohadii]
MLVRPATHADLPAIAQLYSEAFDSNAIYRWVFTGDAAQPAPAGALSWLFLRRARMLLQRGCLLLVGCDAAGQLVAAGGLVPFDRKPGHLDYLRNGILLWLLWYGLASLHRGLCADEDLAAARASGALTGVAGELAMVAVRPDMQGCGLGGRIIAALLEQWDAADGRALALMTQNPRALHLYGRHGFKWLESHHPEAKHPQGGFSNWVECFQAHAGVVCSMAMHPKGERLLTSSVDGTVKAWV